MSVTIRRTIGAVTATAALVLGGTGIASAATTRHTAKEYFLITISGTSETVIAHGAFTGAGRDDASHNNYDILHLGGGQVRIVHPDKDSHFTYKLDPKSCFITFSITGKYTLSHGTGKYKGLTGHGTYKVKEQGITARTSSGACDMNTEPKVLAGYVNGSGPVSWA